MRILLDTNALLFAAFDPKSLSPKANEVLLGSRHQLFYSPISLWEIALLQSKSRIRLKQPIAKFESEVRDNLRASSIGVKAEHFDELNLLEAIHKDTFDRVLIAQGIYEGLSILSSDKIFDRYPIERIW